MKKTTALLVLILAFSLLLSSCGYRHFKRTDDGILISKDNGLEYVSCGVSVKAYSIDKSSVYAVAGGMKYYKIQFQNPKYYISEEDNIMGGVFRLASLPAITLESFNAIAAQVCIVGTGSMIVDQFSAAKEYLSDSSYDYTNYVDGTEYTDAVVNAVLNDERVEVPTYIDDDETRHIYLLSQEYPGLFYDIIFMKATNGNCYLYDRDTQSCVYAPDMIADRLVK